MAEKHKEKINPDAIRELISQGIPMRRKEDSPLCFLRGKGVCRRNSGGRERTL